MNSTFHRASIVTTVLGVCVLWTSTSSAYTRAETNWNPATLPISYRVNVSSAPAAIGGAGARSAVAAGFASWAAPTCTRWRATDAGDSTRTRAGAGDGENSVLWISGAWPAELGDVRVTIGVTTPVWIVGAYFTDADIQFNNVGFTWSLDGRAGTVDTQSIATHEQGHFLGLNHSALTTAVMYAAYRGGLVRALSMDDINGVCAIYPSGGPVPDAGTTMDPCAAYVSCDGCTPVANCGWCGAAGRCMSGATAGPTMGSCAGGWAWQPADCRTVAMDAGSSDPCARNTACGTCTPVANCGWCGATRQCVTGTTTGPIAGSCASGWAWQPVDCTTGTASFGEPCTRPGDCATGGLCVTNGTAAFCSRRCVDDCNCPRGYRCATTTMAGLNVCAPGTNTCPMMPVDAGATDVVTPPTDVVTLRDSGTLPAADTGMPADDAAVDDVSGAVDTGTRRDTGGGVGMDSGCACRTTGTSNPRRGAARWEWMAGVAIVVIARRRRTRSSR